LRKQDKEIEKEVEEKPRLAILSLLTTLINYVGYAASNGGVVVNDEL
jgi:hypothetical protein